MKLRGLFLALAATGLLVAAQPASTAQTDSYADAAGDAQGGAPDITAVGVANVDDQIAFRIVVANQPTLNPDSIIFIFLDTDQNPATGAVNALGADYLIGVGADGRALGRWNGTTWDENVPSSTLRSSYQGGLTLTISRTELGNTGAFNFWLRGFQNTGGTPNIDDAPNDGTWAYRLQTGGGGGSGGGGGGARVTLTKMAVTFTPYPAQAGKLLTAKVLRVTLSNGKKAKPQTVSCSAKVGSKSLGSGCRWRVPTSARGAVRITLSATHSGARRTKTYFVPIRR